jgi:hypothetical protein
MFLTWFLLVEFLFYMCRRKVRSKCYTCEYRHLPEVFYPTPPLGSVYYRRLAGVAVTNKWAAAYSEGPDIPLGVAPEGISTVETTVATRSIHFDLHPQTMGFSLHCSTVYYKVDGVRIGFGDRVFPFSTGLPCSADSGLWFLPVVSTGSPRPGFLLCHQTARSGIMVPTISGGFTPFPSYVELHFVVEEPFEVPLVMNVHFLDVMRVEA